MRGSSSDSTDNEVKFMKETMWVLINHLKKCLNRKDESVLEPFLPCKQEYVLSITLNEIQQNLYKRCVREINQRGRNIMSDQKTLQKIWNHPSPYLEENPEHLTAEEEIGTKLDILLTIIRKVVEKGDKMLVFTESKVSLDEIEKFLASRFKWKRGRNYLRMDGSISVADRKSNVKQFNSDLNNVLNLYLITAKTGGQGLNITSANRVVIYDISWNPTVDVQAIFRAYRMGQTREVYIYRLFAKGKLSYLFSSSFL